MKPQIKYFVLTILFISPFSLFANDDYGVWTGIEVSKDLNTRFSVEGGVNLRIENELNSFTRWKGSLGIKYKINDFLKADVSYNYIYKHNLAEIETIYSVRDSTAINGYEIQEDYWRSKHRFNISLTGKIELGRFDISLRERYQWIRFIGTTVSQNSYRYSTDPTSGEKVLNNTDSDEDSKKYKTKQIARSRFAVDYNINHCPIDPYASIEIYNNFDKELRLSNVRYEIGVNWKIIKHHHLEIGYIFNNEVDNDIDLNTHVLSLNYKIDL